MAQRILPAMSTAITVLLVVAILVFLSMISPSDAFQDPSPVDRDRERLLGEGRAFR
jgi:hypothetical protein